MGDEAGSRVCVHDVGRGEVGFGDQPGFGFDSYMGFVAVSFLVAGFATVPGFGIHCGDGAILRYPPCYPPPSWPLGVGFHVLSRDHPQQPQGVGLFLVQVKALAGFYHRSAVGYQPVHQPGPGLGIGPVTARFGLRFIIMGRQHQPGCFGDDAAATPYLGPDHRHRVLGSNRVVQNRRVQSPTRPTCQHPRPRHHLPHRVEHTIRTITTPQPGPPQSQHRRMKPPIGQRQTRRRLPPDITTQPLHRFPIRHRLQRLEDHHHPDHRTRYRRTAPPSRKQIREHLITEQAETMLRQEPVHRTLRHQIPTHPHRVQQLTVQTLTTQHNTPNHP